VINANTNLLVQHDNRALLHIQSTTASQDSTTNTGTQARYFSRV